VTNRWAVLALIMAAQIMANVGPLGLPAIAPLIRESLDLSVAQAGSFLSAYYIGPALVSLPAGWLADRWGVRGAMILGQALIAIGLFAAAVAPSFSFLVVILVLAGAGYGVLNPTTTKAGMAWFPPRQRATVVGLKQIGLPGGGALGALVLPPIALVFGWRAAVAVSAAVVGGLALLTWALYYPRARQVDGGLLIRGRSGGPGDGGRDPPGPRTPLTGWRLLSRLPQPLEPANPHPGGQLCADSCR